MQPKRWLQISLARKISLFFGTAVMLTIAVTLVFPWLQMTALNEQAMLLQARALAAVAYQASELGESSWPAAQARLKHRWVSLQTELGLPKVHPRLFRDGETEVPDFVADALVRLRRDADQQYYWVMQDEGRIFRFAMAVRGMESDRNPQVLRGVIDVRLRVPQAPGVWNFVVTVLAGASGAVLAILAFYLVTQRLVLSPVQSLRHVTETVATGDLSIRSVIHSGDEFEDLSNALNNMLGHLKEARDEQEKINRSLDVRIGELAETNVALFESNRLKTEFLTNVTHELRTPLVSIIGFAELLRDAGENLDADPDRMKRYTQHILESGRSLLESIDDLLDLAKIEAGKMELHIVDFSLPDLCRDLIDFVRPLADKKNQPVELSLTEDIPSCRSDTGKIKQILYNLLSNAIKFTPEGGAIELAVDSAENERVRLSVRDTGPGIPTDRHETVFEQFLQLDASKTREYEGTGLGLAITRELVHILGGTIRVVSDQGQGATFVVELPVVVPEASERSRISLS